LEVVLNSTENSHLFFTNGDLGFRKVENRGELFTEIHIDGFSKSYDIGNPDLPVFSKLIETPSQGITQIKLERFESGSYFVRLKLNNGQYLTKPIIISK
jgi:hypothetical protein